jgi:hypothetical protein
LLCSVEFLVLNCTSHYHHLIKFTRFITDISIPQKTATIGMGGISVFVLLYLLSNIFWWTLFSSGFIVAAHALFRDASMHKDLDDAVAMEGDLNLGEDAAFLNA